MSHQRLMVLYLLWLLNSTSLNAEGHFNFHAIVIKYCKGLKGFLVGDIVEIITNNNHTAAYGVINMKNRRLQGELPIDCVKVIPRHGNINGCPDAHKQYNGKNVTVSDYCDDGSYKCNVTLTHDRRVVEIPRYCIQPDAEYCGDDPPDEKGEKYHVRIAIINIEELKMVFNFTILPYCFRGRQLSVKHELWTFDRRCENTSEYKNYSRTPQNHVYTVNNVQPNCSYNVTFFIRFRSTSEWTKLDTKFATTKNSGCSENVKGLSVVSYYHNTTTVRWLPPFSQNDVKEYLVEIFGKTGGPRYLTLQKFRVGKCQIWPEYHCGSIFNEDFNLLKNISIVGFNKILNMSIEGKIASCQPKLASIQAESWNSSNLPGNVHIVWFNSSHLNVSWEHPIPIRGYLQGFCVRISINYAPYPDTNVSFSGADKYSRLLDIRSYDGRITNLKVCVQTSVELLTNDEENKSECFIISEPPEPELFSGNVTYQNGTISLSGNWNKHFSSLYVFGVHSDSTERVGWFESMKSYLEKNQTDNAKNVNSMLEMIYDSNGNTLNPVINILYPYIKRKQSKGDNEKKQEHVVIFIVNELERKRKIIYEEVKIEDNSKIRPIIIDNKNGRVFSLEATSITAIFSILLVVIILICVVLYRKKRNSLRNNAESILTLDTSFDYAIPFDQINTAMQYSEVVPCTPEKNSHNVKVEQLGDYIKTAMDNGQLAEQHKQIIKSDHFGINKQCTCFVGNLPENINKNRYVNIVAYDHTRVHLSKKEGTFDYINANFIDGYKWPEAYIATQGPKANTTYDFWSMVWDKDVKHIIMLTKVFDGTRKHCEQYWPEKRNSYERINDFTIRLLDVIEHDTYDIRSLNISHSNRSKVIEQIHFKDWPAAGEPLYPQSLIPLLGKLLIIQYSKSPILLHCSAGIGRTGTIILCDICLRQAGTEGIVDFAQNLAKIRSQRPSMVDNDELYKLAHLAVNAVLTAPKTAINWNGDFEHAVKNIIKKEQMIIGQMNFLIDCEWQNDAMKSVSPMYHEDGLVVECKNKTESILPDKVYQVFLRKIDDDPDSCFINAVEVGGFLAPRRFIATQHPLDVTLEDFWRLIAEQKIKFIIDLQQNDLSDERSVEFALADYSGDNIEVRQIKKEESKTMVLLLLEIFYKLEDHKETVQILRYKYDEQKVELFMEFVVESKSIIDDHRAVVTCQDGATVCGLYIAFSNIIDQMQRHKVCDICTQVNAIRVSRNHFIKDKSQLQLLYKYALFFDLECGLYTYSQ